MNDFETLADVVRHHAALRPSAEAFIFESEMLTFEAFDRATSCVAQGLIACGVGEQARVAYLCRNNVRVFELFYGAAKARSVPVGINWRLALDEVAYILADAEIRLLLCDPEFLPVALAARARCPLLEHVLSTEAVDNENVQAFTSWRDGFDDQDPRLEARRDDVACQLYTSGTTGHPKGVLLTHRNFFEERRQAAQSGTWMNMAPGERCLVVMPTYHIGGLQMGLNTLYAGAATVVSNETDPARLIDTIERQRITCTFLVPAVIQAVLDHPECKPERLASLRVLRYGAAPISAALLRQAQQTLSCDLAQVYGMTESTGSVTCLPPADHKESEFDRRMRSCGKALSGVDIRVKGPSGNDLPPSEVGEICIRADSIMAGYWKLPEATAASFYGEWYRSGDAGYMDEDGYLYPHDRIKDMIVSGGENIYPAEIESVLSDHPAVLECAVIGVPDERWGEAVKAIVVRRPGETVSEPELIAFTRTRIAGYKVPKSIEFLAALPRNPSGKILKRDLRAPYWAGRTRQVN